MPFASSTDRRAYMREYMRNYMRQLPHTWDRDIISLIERTPAPDQSVADYELSPLYINGVHYGPEHSEH